MSTVRDAIFEAWWRQQDINDSLKTHAARAFAAGWEHRKQAHYRAVLKPGVLVPSRLIADSKEIVLKRGNNG